MLRAPATTTSAASSRRRTREKRTSSRSPPTGDRPASGGGNDAQLLQEAEGVPHLPRFGDLAVADLMDRDGVDRDALAGRRDAVQLRDVGARAGPAHDDLVVRGDHLFDPPVALEALLIR